MLAAAALAVALAAPPAALSAGGGSAPSPQRLWRSYPLDSAHTGSIRPAAGPVRRPRVTATASSAASSGLPWAAWFAIALGGLALVAAACGLWRHRALLRSKLRRAASPTGGRTSDPPLTATLVAEIREVSSPEAKAPPSRPPKKVTSIPGRGGDIALKRKPPTSERAVQVLKEKRPPRPGRREEVAALREKLAEPSGRANGAVPTAISRAAPERGVPASACRIDWWRGYVKSEFHAKVRRPDGSEAVLLTSAAFRWSKPTPPPADLPHIARAHAALVAELKTGGWSASGCGDQWYELELQRRHVSAGAERAT
jgi:hypothetical protein